MSGFIIIIPSRYASSRLPGKPLLDIAGKPLIQHVYESACKSQAREVYIATDDERILKAADAFHAKVIMTSDHHESGTDRLAEASDRLGKESDTIIVNLQGDELGMSPRVIDQAADALVNHPDCNISTICEPIECLKQVHDPNVVKVVTDENNFALYFSRAPIPWDREAQGEVNEKISPQTYFRHIGLYAYRQDYLQNFSQTPRCHLEKLECLEQLRALQHGEKIHVSVAVEGTGLGIDTPDDLERARANWAKTG